MKNNRRKHRKPTERATQAAPSTEAIPKDDAPDPNKSVKKRADQINAGEAGMLRWTKVVGLFTVVLAVVSGLQWWAFITSERAFVYEWVTLPSVGLVANKQLVLTINTFNGSRTPAFISEGNVTYLFLKKDVPLPVEPPYVDGAENAIVGPILGGAPLRGAVPLTDKNKHPLILTQSDLDALNAGAFRLYIFGWIKYADDFSVFGPKTNGFCGVYNPGQPPDNAFNNCGRPAYVYSR